MFDGEAAQLGRLEVDKMTASEKDSSQPNQMAVGTAIFCKL
jgi:hypothetical protein